MKILALEFSSETRSVAVLDSTTGSHACSHETGGRSVRTIALIEQVLGEAGIAREQIECLAVGIGPGSYTGIRLAISLAQGWELVAPVKLLAISSMDAMASAAAQTGHRGTIDLAVDAQREEFYLATYELTDGGYREIEPLRLVSLDVLKERVRQGRTLMGPEVAALIPGALHIHPDATSLARLATTRSDYAAAEMLQPIYLRPISFVKAPPPRNYQ